MTPQPGTKRRVPGSLFGAAGIGPTDPRQSLSQGYALLHEFFAMSPAGFLCLDRGGRVLDGNFQAALLLNGADTPMIGRLLYHFIVEEDRDSLYLHLRNLFKRAAANSLKLRIPATDENRLRHLFMKSVPARGLQGEDVCLSAVMDLTELEETEERFVRMAETSVDIIFQLDAAGRFIYCSPAIQRELGYSPEAVRSKPFEILMARSDRMRAFEIYEKMISDKPIDRLEVSLKTADGRTVPFEISVGRHKDLHRGISLFGVARNIGERKASELAERALFREKSEALALLDAIFESAPIGVGFWDRDLRFVRLNQALARMNGLSVEDHIGRKISEVLPNIAANKAVESRWRQSIQTGKAVKNVEISGRTAAAPDEERYWVENWFPVQVRNKTIGIAATVMDITDMKRLEKALHAARDHLEEQVQERTKELSKTNEILREEISKRKRFEEALKASSEKIIEESSRRKVIAARLVDSVESDRRDMGMYLHDQIGQTLTTLKMNLERSRNQVQKESPGAAEGIREAEKDIQAILRQVRRVSRELLPDILETLGLKAATRALVESFADWVPFELKLHMSPRLDEPEPKTALALYRILQEALNNATKHAGAEKVHVNLIRKEHSFLLTVEDDGGGFDISAVAKPTKVEGPLGLMIMRERCDLLNGTLTLDSEPGRGTHLAVEFPAH